MPELAVESVTSPERAREIQRRLRRPENAVCDAGINLRAHKAVFFAIKGHQEGAFKCQRIKPKPVEIVPPEPPKIEVISDDNGPSLTSILDAVCIATNTRAMEIRSQRRNMRVVGPRHVMMLLCIMPTPASLPKIGRFIGGRDHTTVLHATRKLEPIREKLFATLTADAPLIEWAKLAWQIYQDGKSFKPRYRANRTSFAASMRQEG